MIKGYQDKNRSEISWINKYPSHWNVFPFNYLFNFTKGLTITKENLKDEGIPCVNYGEIHSKFGFELIPEEHQLKCVDEDYLELNKNSLLKKGDFVFADTSEDIEGSGNFTYLNSDIPTFAGYHTIIAKPKKIFNRRFVAYFFEALKFRNQIRSKVYGVKVYSITKSIIKSTFILLPETSEQNKIVQFLDHKTVLIDKFIANRKRQIELLQEKKAAIINKAVTKGINPDVKLKPSGVEWIDDIPEHWEISHLRRYLVLLTDFSSNGSFATLRENVKYIDTEDFARLVRLTDLRANFANDGIYVNEHAYNFLAKSSLHGDELLIANVGAYAGLVCLMPKVNFKATLGPNMSILKFNPKKYDIDFIFTLLSSHCYQAFISNKAQSSAQPKLNKEDMKSIPVVRPPKNEQGDVIRYIRDESKPLQVLIEKYQNQIALIKEYKTALISKVVTGKIDVRDWQPPKEEKHEI